MRRQRASRRAPAAVEMQGLAMAPTAKLQEFVHDVVNPLAAIKYAASALRTSKTLTEHEMADVRRTEKAAGMVVRMIERLAETPDVVLGAGTSAEKTVDLYVLCCELAARRRIEGRVIQCRAHGDPRGPWNRPRLVRVVATMLDRTLIHVGKHSTMTIIVTGMERHVRLDVHGLGHLSPKRQRACLDFPNTITDKLGGTLTATVSANGGTIFTLRLAR